MNAPKTIRNTFLALAACAALVGCDPKDAAIAAQGEVIKLQIKSSCGDETACTAAVEAQFDACFEASGYDRFVDGKSFDEREAIMQQAIYDIFGCFRDDAGDPFFSVPAASKTS